MGADGDVGPRRTRAVDSVFAADAAADQALIAGNPPETGPEHTDVVERG
jgi:hypothetical protein